MKNPNMRRTGACHSPEARAKAAATNRARRRAAKKTDTEARLMREICAEFELAEIERRQDGSFSWDSHGAVDGEFEVGERVSEGEFLVNDDGTIAYNRRKTYWPLQGDPDDWKEWRKE
jgi:hypothetical protein